jgi:hypothetical protein
MKPVSTLKEAEEIDKKIVEAAAAITGSAGRKKGPKTWKESYLPFQNDPNRINYLQCWQAEFVPGAMAWASSLDDPFRTSRHPDLKNVVETMWTQIYPKWPWQNDYEKSMVGVVSSKHILTSFLQTTQHLYDWQSNIGKEAVKAVEEALRTYKKQSDDSDVLTPVLKTKKNKADIVKLQRKDHSYLYKYPSANDVCPLSTSVPFFPLINF